jgi:quercetin dioxygenase-like cupin family protein
MEKMAEKNYGHFPDRLAWDLALGPATRVDDDGFQVFASDQADITAKASALARTDELGVYIGRFPAGGGENGLHSHPGDSVWVVLSGAASFWAADSRLLGELGPAAGVMVPGGAPYRFLCSEDSVIMRFSGPPPAPRADGG